MSFLIFFIFSLLPIFGRSYIFSDEKKLRSILLNDNVTRALPTVNSSVPVQTRIQLNLHSVYNLDITKQILSSSVLILITWKDESLMWNINLYNGLSRLMIPSSMIWTPDIVLLNSMESKTFCHSNDEVLLESDGIVTLSAYLNLVTYCHVDTTLYPFDSQTCDLVFSKLYLSDRYHYLCHNDSNNIIESYVSNGEWDIRDIQRLNKTKYSLLGTFTDIIFRVVLERKTDYYYWTYVVPMISLAVVDVATFCLPVKSHEKLNICLFVFLSMVYLVTVVNDSMPHTSDNISKFGTLLWFFILLSGLIILTNILIITMVHRKSPKCLPPVVLKCKQCIISFCMMCVHYCKRCPTRFCSGISQLIKMLRLKLNINKDKSTSIEMTNTDLQDESTESSRLMGTDDRTKLQQKEKQTDPPDPEIERSKETDGNDNSGMPFPTKTKAKPSGESTLTTFVTIHEDTDANISDNQNVSNDQHTSNASTNDDKTVSETSTRFQLELNDNSETPNNNQSTDENISVIKKSTETNIHTEAVAEIKDGKNTSDSTNTIDVSTKGENGETDHANENENSENNVDIKDLNEGQKDNIKDPVVDESEDKSASHVLKLKDIQLIEKSDEKADGKNNGSLPNPSGFDKSHGTNLSIDPKGEKDKNEIDDKMHDISITTDSNDSVKANHSSVHTQHSSNGNSNISLHSEVIGMDQNQSFENRQTTSSTNANIEPSQQMSGSGEKKSEPEKVWHSTACCLDVMFCIIFMLAFGISYWAILGQLLAKNHNIM